MITFDEYQNIAAKVPIALRNDRDRIELPVLGLQEAAGRFGKLLSVTFASGKLHLTPAQKGGREKARWPAVFGAAPRLCGETGISMENVAKHGIAQLQARAGELD